MGKYSPLDFETLEPLNPLDGLLKKTKYGGEVVVGKSFFMSWLGAWKDWLDFDNFRGTVLSGLECLCTMDSATNHRLCHVLVRWCGVRF
jgi:alpha-glucuronidase